LEILTYKEALEYLYSFAEFSHPDQPSSPRELTRVRWLLERMGNPHRQLPVVHVAGTKGKGSTAAMGAAILQAAGYRTGLYTSPHLHSFRERIQINGELIPEEEVVALVRRLRPYVDRLTGVKPFEIITVMAFLYFVEQKVDIAVMETGVGGEKDSTNVACSRVSIITSISYDHMNVLGDTLGEIAHAKAGIARPGVPLINHPQAPEAAAAIQAVCRQRNTPLVQVGRDWTWTPLNVDIQRGQSFLVHPPEEGEQFWIPLLGQHQVINATAVIAAMHALREQGFPIPDAAIHQGLREVQWPGRLEILAQQPYVILDGAHNTDSARKLYTALEKLFPDQPYILVLGATAGKDIPGMLKVLLPHARRVIITQADHPRAASAEDILAQVKALGYAAEMCSGVASALEQAVNAANPHAVVCVTGSLFIVAEAREAWLARAGFPLPPRDPL